MSERRPAEEVVPPQEHIRQAGHHWLREFDSDGHYIQTIVCQWQPNYEKWCHSGQVASGHEIDTTYWEYEAPCPMPSTAVSRKIIVDDGIWSALMPTESQALQNQLLSMLFRQADQHFRKTMKDADRKTWLDAAGRKEFYTIDELTIGDTLSLLIKFGLPVSVTVGE